MCRGSGGESGMHAILRGPLPLDGCASFERYGPASLERYLPEEACRVSCVESGLHDMLMFRANRGPLCFGCGVESDHLV